MGVQITEILPKKEIELADLVGKKIAIDAFNTIFQFLSIIRDRFTGEPLRDSKGRITSHLSGLLYRTSHLLEAGIKPVFVFDGESPTFKKQTIEARAEIRAEAEKKWKEAVAKGEPAIKYAQAASKLTDEMLDESKKLLELMGVPWVQAPSEGEAQCAYMCLKNQVYAAASQDNDSLLFGSPRLVRNLSIEGKRKMPKKEVYMEIKPELIELQEVLKQLGISREQLIILGILVGTDYNPEGVKGFGPKKSLQLVKTKKRLEEILSSIDWQYATPAQEIFNFFLNPPTTDDYVIEWKRPKTEKLISFMVDEHDFSLERVQKVVEKINESFEKSSQATLAGWFKK
jgi:flap endonuclease-1